MEGTIKNLNSKGFGFIATEGSDKDIFFHANDLAEGSFEQLSQGDPVTFDMGESPKGPKAVNVKRA